MTIEVQTDAPLAPGTYEVTLRRQTAPGIVLGRAIIELAES
jgi:hypothetical protein